MKNFISISVILCLSVIFLSATTESPTNIEITVKSSSINNRGIISKLISEFDRLSGVIHSESSMKTNTLMIIYNDAFNFSEEKIESIFSKWGCDDLEISYSLIN